MMTTSQGSTRLIVGRKMEKWPGIERGVGNTLNESEISGWGGEQRKQGWKRHNMKKKEGRKTNCIVFILYDDTSSGGSFPPLGCFWLFWIYEQQLAWSCDIFTGCFYIHVSIHLFTSAHPPSLRPTLHLWLPLSGCTWCATDFDKMRSRKFRQSHKKSIWRSNSVQVSLTECMLGGFVHHVDYGHWQFSADAD